MREQEAIRRRLLALDPSRERMFRINAGVGWTGSQIRRMRDAIIISDPRPLHAAPIGWPDLCGWRTVTVTPDMIGMKIAVFCGEEFKLTGDLRSEQRAFRDILETMGGAYTVVRG